MTHPIETLIKAILIQRKYNNMSFQEFVKILEDYTGEEFQNKDECGISGRRNIEFIPKSCIDGFNWLAGLDVHMLHEAFIAGVKAGEKGIDYENGGSPNQAYEHWIGTSIKIETPSQKEKALS